MQANHLLDWLADVK